MPSKAFWQLGAEVTNVHQNVIDLSRVTQPADPPPLGDSPRRFGCFLVIMILLVN